MHWENAKPLAGAWPVLGLLVSIGLALFIWNRRNLGRANRDSDTLARAYWLQEAAHESRMKVREWMGRWRRLRLAYQPAPSDEAIAVALAGGYAEQMDDRSFPTRLARAKFRAWHRGTREADFTIGGFFDRHHQTWGEADLSWFEDLLEEEDGDILGWAMATHVPPEKYRGPLMSALQKLDYVAI